MQTDVAVGSTRVHWVDWLKVLAVLAIFFYHVALVFSITPWMISNPQHSMVLSGIAGWGYLWGLQLLFWLAGASSYYARRRRSAVRFAGERLVRLGVPLLLGLLTLSPFQAYWQALGHGSQLTFAQFLPGYLHRLQFYFDPVWLIRYGYHLWFLGFLLAISVTALPIQGVMDRMPQALRRRFPADRPWPAAAVFLPALAVAAVQIALRPYFPPDMSWPDLAADLVFYIGGYALAGSGGFAVAARQTSTRSLVVAIAGWSAVGMLFLLHGAPGWNVGYYRGTSLVTFELAHAFGTWGWILFLAGVAMRRLDRPHPAISYGNDAILPFYVLHHPVVVVLGFYVIQLPFGVWPKFALLFAGGFAITTAVYEVVIRHFGPLRLLFGLRYASPAGPRAGLPPAATPARA